MRLTISGNVPSRFHDEVSAIIRAGFKGTHDAGVEVHVKAQPKDRLRSAEFSGTAYQGVPSLANVAKTTRWLVTLHIPREPDRIEYPRGWRYPGLKTAPEFHFCCWQADLFHLSAHEAAHVRQFQNGRSCSEVKAERWAARMMERTPCLGCGSTP